MSRSAPRWPLVLPLVLAALVAVRLLLLWAARIGYPFDLEWMEGGLLVHAWRLTHGLPLYPAPGRSFIPYIYPPGYASVIAALGMVTGGVGYPVARLVSLAGTVAAAAAIVLIVRRDGGSVLWGLVGAALFLGCYEYVGAFYDLVRPDGLAIGLLSWSLVLMLDGRRGTLAASGLLLAAAFVVKQHSAAFGFPMVLGVGLRDGWKGALRFAAWSALPALAVTGVLEATSAGRYLVYILAVPASHGMVFARIFPGTPWELAHALLLPLVLAALFAVDVFVPWGTRAARLGVAGAALVLAGFGLAWAAPRGGPLHFPFLSVAGIGALLVGGLAFVIAAIVPAWRRRLSWRAVTGAGFAVFGVGVSAMMRGHVGGFVNVLIPGCWVVALAGAMAMAHWDRRGAHLGRTLLFGALAAVQLSVQDADLWGWHGRTRAPDPEMTGWRAWVAADPLVPTPRDRAAGEGVVAQLRDLPDPVWSPFAPWLAVQAGHAPGLHLIALWDIDHRRGPLRAGAQDVKSAIASGWWGAIVDGSRPVKYGTERYYRRLQVLRVPRGTFEPRTGWRARPTTVLVPRDQVGK